MNDEMPIQWKRTNLQRITPQAQQGYDMANRINGTNIQPLDVKGRDQHGNMPLSDDKPHTVEYQAFEQPEPQQILAEPESGQTDADGEPVEDERQTLPARLRGALKRG